MTEPGNLEGEERHCHVRHDRSQNRQGCLGSVGGGRILGEAREKVPCLKARNELFAVKRWAQQMTLEREVLADGAES